MKGKKCRSQQQNIIDEDYTSGALIIGSFPYTGRRKRPGNERISEARRRMRLSHPGLQ